MAGSDLERSALMSAVLHLVGQSRAFLRQLEAAMHEISTLDDERADRLVEALQLTTVDPPKPGTVRHIEQAASFLLRELREVEAS